MVREVKGRPKSRDRLPTRKNEPDIYRTISRSTDLDWNLPGSLSTFLWVRKMVMMSLQPSSTCTIKRQYFEAFLLIFL